VEYFEDENSKLFEVEKKIIKQGTCEYCNKNQYLRYVCACKEVLLLILSMFIDHLIIII